MYFCASADSALKMVLMLLRAFLAGSIWFAQATNRIAAEHNARYFATFRMDFTGESPGGRPNAYATPCRERIASQGAARPALAPRESSRALKCRYFRRR